MQIKNATEADITSALYKANERFNRNLSVACATLGGGGYGVALRASDASGAGAATSTSGRKTYGACWHAHGVFFDYLIEICPSVVIVSNGLRITRDGGNWTDRLVGLGKSASEMCRCGSNHDRPQPLPETPMQNRYDIPPGGVERNMMVELKPPRFEDEVI